MIIGHSALYTQTSYHRTRFIWTINTRHIFINNKQFIILRYVYCYILRMAFLMFHSKNMSLEEYCVQTVNLSEIIRYKPFEKCLIRKLIFYANRIYIINIHHELRKPHLLLSTIFFSDYIIMAIFCIFFFSIFL